MDPYDAADRSDAPTGERDRAARQVSSLDAELAQTTARADAGEVELEKVRAELASQRQLADERQMLNTRLEDDRCT